MEKKAKVTLETGTTTLATAAIASAIVLNEAGNTEGAIVALLIGVVIFAVKYVTRE